MTPAEVDRYTRRRPLQPLDYRYDRYDRYSTPLHHLLSRAQIIFHMYYGFTYLHFYPPPSPSSQGPLRRAPTNQVTAGLRLREFSHA